MVDTRKGGGRSIDQIGSRGKLCRKISKQWNVYEEERFLSDRPENFSFSRDSFS